MRYIPVFTLLIIMTISLGCVQNQEHVSKDTIIDTINPVLTPSNETAIIDKTHYSNGSFRYTLKGQTNHISINLYESVYNHLKSTGLHDESSDESLLTRQQISIQNSEIDKLVDAIKERSLYRDDEARIAISLVQNIKYSEPTERMMYEVLFEQKGACGEKSELLVYLLNKLGYEAVLLKFPQDNHMAVGVKCPSQYSYQKSGYCFIETTEISIPTYSNGEYKGIGKLHKEYMITHISNQNRSFSTIGDEALDAAEVDRIQAGQIERNDYNEMMHIFTKYGIPTSEPRNVNDGQLSYHYS